MRGINKKIISLFLAFAIVLTTFSLSSNTSYAASIKLNKTNITLLRKQISQLKVKNTKKKVTWYSSNKSVATVSKTGKVTGQKKGTAVITAKVGSKKYRCKVKVSKQYSKTYIKKYLNKNTQDGYTEIGYKTVHKGVVYYFYHGGISSPNFSRGWQGFINAETLERYLSLP